MIDWTAEYTITMYLLIIYTERIINIKNKLIMTFLSTMANDNIFIKP